MRMQRLFWSVLLLLGGIALLHYIVLRNKLQESTDDFETQKTIVTSLDFVFTNKPKVQESTGYFERRKTRVTPLDFDFTISGPAGCRTEDSPLMVVLVLTIHDHVEERKAIRETWGSVVRAKQWGKDYIPASVIVIFMLGSPDEPSKSQLVKKENEQFHDIVEANFKDSYYNLTYKVLMGYKWVKTFCPSTKYVMKVDEDTFLNIKHMVKILETVDLRNTVLGSYFETAPVERGGKHGIKKQEYPLDNYPPHVKGNFYLMPTKLALSVLDVSEYMPYVCIEDAYITGILVQVVGGKHVGVSASSYQPFQNKPPEICDFAKPFKLAAQKVVPDKARQIWKTILGEHKC